MKAPVVRVWREEDIPKIAHLEKQLSHQPWNESMLKEEFFNANYTCLVCECGGETVGYAGFYTVCDYAEISNIAVKTDCQGQGIGQRLMQEVFKTAKEKGLTSITLEVGEHNTKAGRLYQKLGFSKQGERPNYYGKGEAAYILWKRFD